MSTHNRLKFVGLTEEGARKLASEHFAEFRVVSRDGNHYIVTRDYNEDRINVAIDNGKVTSAHIG
jgi:hypothetical protein